MSAEAPSERPPPQAPFALRLRLGALIERWQARPPDAVYPIILEARRIYILPSGGGLLFAAALIVMLLGAINYDLGLGHALVFLLASLGLVGMVHTWRNLLRLQLTPGRADPVFAGETAYFHCQLDNPEATPRRALELRFAGHAHSVEIALDAHARTTIAVPCPAPQRGRLIPGRLLISTRYPLGLFTAWSTPRPRLATLVYPTPEYHRLPAPATPRGHGEQPGAAGQEDFAGLRLHQANDPPRHIAWKAVARDFEHRPLLVKQFSGGTADDGELSLDWAHTAPLAQGDDERSLSILTGWVLAAERQQLAYGLRLPGRVLAPGRGPAHRHACLEALALHGAPNAEEEHA